MRLPKLALLIVGGLAMLLGLIWIGQGTGYFPYPAQSFMINAMPWAWRGAGLMVFGFVLIMLGRRL